MTEVTDITTPGNEEAFTVGKATSPGQIHRQ